MPEIGIPEPMGFITVDPAVAEFLNSLFGVQPDEAPAEDAKPARTVGAIRLTNGHRIATKETAEQIMASIGVAAYPFVQVTERAGQERTIFVNINEIATLV